MRLIDRFKYGTCLPRSTPGLFAPIIARDGKPAKLEMLTAGELQARLVQQERERAETEAALRNKDAQ